MAFILSTEILTQKLSEVIGLWRSGRYERLATAAAAGLISAFVWVWNSEKFFGSMHTRALVLLGVFAAVCVLFVIRRLSSIQTPGQELSKVSLSIKGPLAFSEKDSEIFARLGRGQTTNEILNFIASNQSPLILVSGESGAGKTSILRAGVTPLVKGELNRPVVYWEAKPTKPFESLTSTLLRELQASPEITSIQDILDGKLAVIHPVVMIDQLEQLNFANAEHRPVYDLISSIATGANPSAATWVLAFRRDFVGVYEYLFDHTHGSAAPLIIVKSFSRKRAQEVMATLGEAAGISLEIALLEDFTKSVMVDQMVSPVDIGIGTLMLVNLAGESPEKQTLRLADYRFAGGSLGVLIGYIRNRLAEYPSPWHSELLTALLALVDLPNNRRVAEGLTISSLPVMTYLSKARLQEVFQRFSAPHIRLTERLEDSATGEEVFRLPHERFIPALRVLAGGSVANDELARVVLDTGFRAHAQAPETRYLLSGVNLKTVREMAARNQTEIPIAELDYIRESVRAWRLTIAMRSVAVLVAAVLLGLTTIHRVWSPESTQLETYSNFSSPPLPFPDSNMILVYSSEISTGSDEFSDMNTVSAAKLYRASNGQFLRAGKFSVIQDRDGACEQRGALAVESSSGQANLLNLRDMTSVLLPPDFLGKRNLFFVGSCSLIGYWQNASPFPTAASAARQSAIVKSEAQVLHVWDIETRRPAFDLHEYPLLFRGTLFPASEIGSLIAFSQGLTGPQIGVWDIATGLEKIHISPPEKASFFFDIVANPRNHTIFALTKTTDKTYRLNLYDWHGGGLLHSITAGSHHFPETRLLAGGTIIELLTQDGTHLLHADDLSPASELPSPLIPNRPAVDWAFLQEGKDAIALLPSCAGTLAPCRTKDHGISTAGKIRFRDVVAALLKDIRVDATSAVVMLLDKTGRLQRCAPSAEDGYKCKPISADVDQFRNVVNASLFGVTMRQDNSLLLIKPDGSVVTSGIRGDWEMSELITYDPECNDVYAWTSSGARIRYRQRWMLFDRLVLPSFKSCQTSSNKTEKAFH